MLVLRFIISAIVTVFLLGPILNLHAEESRIWIKKHFTGGRQCETKKSEWPDPEKEFKKQGIKIYDKKSVSGYVCAACGCPAYSFDQYFQIDKADETKAEELEFRR